LTDGLIYKFVLKDSNDVTIATYDNISGINSNFVAYTNQQEIQTATAGQTVFNLTTMSYQVGTNSLSVFVDGVNQYGPGAQYAYTETDDNTVTFVSGLHVGAEVKFTTSQQQGAGAVDASQVSYTPPFTGSETTNVEAKLAQYVSVKDFGAVGDGVTDDTTAIQDAIDEVSANGGGLLYAPEGTYICSAALTLKDTVQLYGDGPKSSIFEFTSATDNGVEIPANITKLGLSNIKLYASAGSTGTGVVYSDTSDACREFVLDDYEIEGFDIGVRLAFGINCIIGQGRIIGPGNTVTGSIGIYCGDDLAVGTYATQIGKAYISAFETGYRGERDKGTIAQNTVFENCYFAVVLDSSTPNSAVTLMAPYFEANEPTASLVQAVNANVHVTIINPYAYNTAPVTDFSARVSGTNITLLMSVGEPGFAAPSTLSRKGADDTISQMECYSDNSGNSAVLNMLKSHQDTAGNTATVDTEFLGQWKISGVNSSSAQAVAAQIVAKQVGAAGAAYVGAELALRVGSNAAAVADAVVVRRGANAEMSLLIERNDAGVFSLQRVKVGNADSGGLGYRALVIDN
jgi:hypothetical protein